MKSLMPSRRLSAAALFAAALSAGITPAAEMNVDVAAAREQARREGKPLMLYVLDSA